MASMGSTILTMGTLLSRAQDQGIPVRILVEGQWISGTPIASDSHGVVLDNPDEGQYLVKSVAVTAVVYTPDSVYGSPVTTTVTREDAPAEPQARTAYAPERRAVEAGGAGDQSSSSPA